MSRIRVAMVADYPLGGERIDGGVQAVSAYIVDGMRKDPRIDLNVVTLRAGLGAPEVVVEDGLKVHLLPRARRGNITFYRKDLAVFSECIDQIRPDLVHAQGAAVEGYLAAKCGLPAVVTFHGIIGEDARYKTGFREKLRFRLISAIAEDYCVRAGVAKILISPYVQRYYGDHLKGARRLIANPTKDDFFSLRRSEVPGRILYAGRIIRRKGILDLVRAIGCLDPGLEYELVLAGAVDDREYVRSVESLISQLGLGERVRFLGLLDEKRLLDEFSKAAMLVLPSYQETAPMVIQQALAARVPVIATAICGVPDQLEGDAGLMFAPGDVESCAAHIERLLTDDGFRGELAGRAYQRALQLFHVKSVVAATIDFYETIVGRDS